MKLLLVFPPTRQGVKSPLLQTEGEGIGHKPPLGLLSIAAFVHGYSAASGGRAGFRRPAAL